VRHHIEPLVIKELDIFDKVTLAKLLARQNSSTIVIACDHPETNVRPVHRIVVSQVSKSRVWITQQIWIHRVETEMLEIHENLDYSQRDTISLRLPRT
jgi:hypothetical protein